VNYTDSRVGNATVLTKVLRQAAENGDAASNLNSSEKRAVDEALKNVPRYDNGEFGYYIRYNATVVQVQTANY